jgi:hypothetical protein
LRTRLQSVIREDEAATVVGQMSNADLMLCIGARRDCFGRTLANAMAGDTLTPDEAQHLKNIQQLLRLSNNDLGALASRITRAEALGRIDGWSRPSTRSVLSVRPVKLIFYIESRAHEDWKLVKATYDDGGFSGGTMERPVLQ